MLTSQGRTRPASPARRSLSTARSASWSCCRSRLLRVRTLGAADTNSTM